MLLLKQLRHTLPIWSSVSFKFDNHTPYTERERETDRQTETETDNLSGITALFVVPYLWVILFF